MKIELKGVTKTYGSKNALDLVTTEFETGHIYGLLGRNGAGKSTMIKLCTNMIYPTAGTIEADGRSLGSDPSLKRNVFAIGEENPFVSGDKVNLIFRQAEQYSGADRNEMERLADSFELPLKKSWEKLSTGYRTIFKDILALTSPARFVFFDEPILGLDAAHRELFYTLLLERFTPDRCFVISTHLIEEVASLLDSVKLIHKGKLIVDEDKDKLLQNIRKVTVTSEALGSVTGSYEILSKTESLGKITMTVRGEVNAPDGCVSHADLQDAFIALAR
ncbi:MAG: ABC transporter ATP-binding protein [Spirochaetales bacterium]|nr:ABC transporter ATP-binding protein [Spirochaetales bacterium]